MYSQSYVPPLRERRDDIPRLVRHFTQRFARRMGRRIETISSETMDALTRYSWPGNVRELQNVIERAVILSRRYVAQVPLGDLQSPSREIESKRCDGYARRRRTRAHSQRVARDRLGNWRSERGCSPSRNEAFDAAMEDETARHF